MFGHGLSVYYLQATRTRHREPDLNNTHSSLGSHKPGLATTNVTKKRNEMCSIQQRKTISSEEAREGHKNDRLYCRDFPVEAYFSQLTPDVRITTQSDLYQANLTESHRT